MPSNLRRIQFLNVGFRKKAERRTFLEFKMHLNFSTKKHVECASHIESKAVLNILAMSVVLS
jgi:hypothetical protein